MNVEGKLTGIILFRIQVSSFFVFKVKVGDDEAAGAVVSLFGVRVVELVRRCSFLFPFWSKKIELWWVFFTWTAIRVNSLAGYIHVNDLLPAREVPLI